MNLVDRTQGRATKFFGVHFFPKRNSADQVMRHFRESPGIGLGREKIEPAINLKCIATDDFGIDLASNVGRDLRLSSSSGADDEKNVFQKSKAVEAAVLSRKLRHLARQDTRLYSRKQKPGDALSLRLPVLKLQNFNRDVARSTWPR
jgi:pSer/pThr/pTyr-binding forkhead associated (FHA) protein